MVKVKSSLAAVAVLLALSVPAMADGDGDESDDMADRRVEALIERAGAQYQRGSEASWWKYKNKGYRGWKRYMHYQKCYSPAGDCGYRYKNNGFGNGDQDAPGNSEYTNNAENAGGNGS